MAWYAFIGSSQSILLTILYVVKYQLILLSIFSLSLSAVCVFVFVLYDVWAVMIVWTIRWLGGLLVERRTSVSQILGSIPGQVAAV